MLNQILQGLFDGYKAANGGQRKQREWEFNHLETSHMLYGSDFLWEKYHQAETEEELYKIRRHMVKHRTGGIESYDEIYGAIYGKLKKMEKQQQRG